jgi:DNA-directed RNA polymerase alpha subunit
MKIGFRERIGDWKLEGDIDHEGNLVLVVSNVCGGRVSIDATRIGTRRKLQITKGSVLSEDDPMDDLLVDVRTYNALRNADVRTVGDVLRLTDAELLSFRNFGKSSLASLNDVLDAEGLERQKVAPKETVKQEAPGSVTELFEKAEICAT